MQRVAVLGGGITGLAAAYRCRELAAERGIPVQVTVLERSSRAGGCIETHNEAGFVLEMGPDSLVTEKPAAIDLAKRLGLGDEISPVQPAFRGARVVRAGRLVPIPDDFRLFTPLSLGGLITSGLFTPMGVARAAIEPFIPAKRTVGDESLASFVTRRFGREILDRLAQPLIGGIYSGDPGRLSMQATLPQLLEIERTYGSLVRGMQAAAAKTKSSPAPARLVSLRSGLGALADALQRELGASVRTGSEILGLRRGESATWTISLAGGAEIAADAVICTLPAYETSRLLRDLQPHAAELLRAIAYHSVATVTFVYETQDIPTLPRCTGFVVPQIEKRKIMATTFSSQKYAGRAPDGSTVLRAFVGGALNKSLAELGDEDLIDAVRAEFRELLGIVAPPRSCLVRRWPDALPEYTVGHTDAVDEIERAVAMLGRFAVAGAAYRGVGIADCVRRGEEAAAAILSGGSHSGLTRVGEKCHPHT